MQSYSFVQCLNVNYISILNSHFLIAQLQASFRGNWDSILGLGVDAFEGAIPLEDVYSLRGRTSPIISVGKRLWKGITGDLWKILPAKAETFIRRVVGDREYKKYRDLNKEEKIFYDRLIIADKKTNSQAVGEFLEAIIAKMTAEELFASGEISRLDSLKMKRDAGYDDKKILKTLEEKGMKEVENYAVINSINEEEVQKNLQRGLEMIIDEGVEPKDVAKKLDEENEFYHDEKAYEQEIDFIMTLDEEDKLLEYISQLQEEGYDWLEINEKRISFKNQLYLARK